jgi:hypothetical protein
MISHQKGKYAWEFMFLAANQDAISEGAALGIGANMSYNYCSTAVGGTTKAFSNITRAACSYRTTGAVGDLNKDDDKGPQDITTTIKS